MSVLPYRLRRHPRARRLRLRVEMDGALVVTAPHGVAKAQIDGFVAAHAAWAKQARREQLCRHDDSDPDVVGMRPGRIELPAAGERWKVSYSEQNDECPPEVLGFAGVIHVPADASDMQVAGRLQDWLKQRARVVLTPQIQGLSRTTGLRYKRLGFRNQSTRWGSCSSTGTLSFNARLLFCPLPACRYVIIHELVHLEHLDHSPRFWARVADFCPDYSLMEKELQKVWARLPDWVVARP